MSKVIIALLFLIFFIIFLLLFWIIVFTIALLIFSRKRKKGETPFYGKEKRGVL
jgi:cell division protein FtsX